MGVLRAKVDGSWQDIQWGFTLPELDSRFDGRYVNVTGDTMTGNLILPGGYTLGTHPVHGGTAIWPTADPAATGYGFLMVAGDTYLNAPAAGTVNLRVNNATIAYGNATALVVPVNRVEFSGYGGGFYMQDTTWIRTVGDKNIYAGNGHFACEGSITVGYNGVTNAAYRSYINGNGHFSGTLGVGGVCNLASINCAHVSASGQLRSNFVSTDSWDQANLLGYQNTNTTTRMALHAPGYAPQWRVFTGVGQAMECVNLSNNAYIQLNAASFIVSSSRETKRLIRPLRVVPEQVTVHHDEFSDEVPPIDVMALRPIKFRRKTLMHKIVPKPGLAEYDGEDPETYDVIDEPADTVLGRETRREVLGLIAEEVQHVLPSAVSHRQDGSAVGIDYAQITVALLDHVQRLTEKVEQLEAQLATVRTAA